MTELEKKSRQALVPSEWEYAPAPESREIVRIDERYGHFVEAFRAARTARSTSSGPASAISARVSSVAGLIVSNHLPLVGSTSSPPMNSP